MCQASAGATVKDQPESVSWINRNSVKDQVTPERQASPNTTFSQCPRQDSNLRFRLRRPALYPLSYGGNGGVGGPPEAW